jgi:hypothetical protein
VELRTRGEDRIPLSLAELAPVEQVAPMGVVDGFEILEIRGEQDPRTAIASLATREGWEIRAMERVMPSLEEAFLKVVGREH